MADNGSFLSDRWAGREEGEGEGKRDTAYVPASVFLQEKWIS